MKVIVTSCSKLQNINPQPVWAEIRAEQPDVLLMLGDNVYLDSNHHQHPADLREALMALYKAQFAEPNFAALLQDLRQRQAPLIAIYDDHDFLGNNRYGGDASPALREAARQAFIDTFHPQQTAADVYSCQRCGPVTVFLLDERFYRTAPHISAQDRDAVLGAQQWAWLEAQFHAAATPEAPFRLIASSTTIHKFADEHWQQYPAALARLRALMADVPGAFVVSGDVHRNALDDDSGIVEIVTSGVARQSLLLKHELRNYAVLDFDPAGMRVQLRSRKPHERHDLRLSLADWRLPS